MKIKKLLDFKDCKKCRQCCEFKKGDDAWAPVFSKQEVEAATKEFKKIKSAWKKYKRSASSYQPRLVKSKKIRNYYVCPFLNEKRHSCFIEKIKPFDCRIWPFVLMKNKKNDTLNLVYYGRKICPGLASVGARRFDSYKKYLINFCKLNSIVPYLGASWKYDPEAIRVCEIMKIPKGLIF